MFIESSTKTYVIASPLEGKLVDGGSAMANAKLVRKLEWNGDKEGVEEQVFHTDGDGNFSLPLFEVETTMRGLEQFVGKSKIYFENTEQARELLWYSATMKEEVYSDTGGPVGDLVCDISNPKVVTQETPRKVTTRCRWGNMSRYIEI